MRKCNHPMMTACESGPESPGACIHFSEDRAFLDRRIMYERMHDEIGAERRRPCGHAGARRDSASSRTAGILSNGPTLEFPQRVYAKGIPVTQSLGGEPKIRIGQRGRGLRTLRRGGP
jgi:hypothetical protein